MKKGKYDDIIGMSHHESKTHERMSMMARAAQFAPFAALNGHEELITETARVTGSKRELSYDEKEILSRRLNFALERKCDQTIVRITFFVPDPCKQGGETIQTLGRITGIDHSTRTLRLEDGFRIPLDDILQIDGDLFS